MATPTIEVVAERLDGLERENRRLRWMIAGLFAVACALLAPMRLGKPAGRVIDAEKLVIRNKAGQVRATLGLDASEQPGLKMFDRRGLEQVALEVPGDNSASLTLFDKGNTRVALDASADGSAGLRLFDRGQQSTSALFMWPDSTAGLTFNMGRQALMMGIQPNGQSAVFTTDSQGRENGRVGAASVTGRTLGIFRGPVMTMTDPGPRPAAQSPSQAYRGLSEPEVFRSDRLSYRGMPN